MALRVQVECVLEMRVQCYRCLLQFRKLLYVAATPLVDGFFCSYCLQPTGWGCVYVLMVAECKQLELLQGLSMWLHAPYCQLLQAYCLGIIG